MKILILSDIHSNYDALKQLELNLDKIEYGEIWCLGDVIGYGAEPEKCIEWVRKRCKYILMGNHDYAVLNADQKFLFNEYAKRAIEWTADKISEPYKIFLKSFKMNIKLEDVYLVHSSPSSPEKWEYIFSADEALFNFKFFEEKICFIGHTHVPIIFEFKQDKMKIIFPEYRMGKFVYRLDRDSKYIINHGSVGQPRDGDPRLSFCVFDREYYIMEFFRMEYPVEKAAEKIFKSDLPDFLGDRLFIGR